MLRTFDTAGSVGLVTDVEPYKLPAGAWSDGRNIRTRDGRIQTVRGFSTRYTTAVAPYWLHAVPSGANLYWVYAGIDKLYAIDGETHVNITRQSAGVDVNYAATEAKGWNGGIFNGLLIANNAIDVPQSWDGSPGNRAQDLANWPAATTAKAVRPFGNFLVMLAPTESGNTYEEVVWWSEAADPGQVPPDWDYASETSRSGRNPLIDEGGYLIDCLPLRGANIVYKEGSAWSMRLVGGRFVFAFEPLLATVGAISQHCIASYRGEGHVVMGYDDVYIHDGAAAQSLLDKKMRRWLFSQIDGENYATSFLTVDHQSKELLICYPEAGATRPNKAIAWNWRENTLGVRDLPDVAFIAYGATDAGSGATSWDADGADWNSEDTTWNARTYNPASRKSLVAVPGDSTIRLLDDGFATGGNPLECYVERTGLALEPEGGNPAQALTVDKRVRAIYPRLTCTSGQTVGISVGVAETPQGGITWEGPYTFDPASQTKVDFRSTGKLCAVRFYSNAQMAWELEGFGIDFEYQGARL